MPEIKFGSKIFDLSLIKEGVQVDTQNKFFKKYDTDNNSIFSAEEINQLQSDLEKYAGDDKILQDEEVLKFYAEKMSLSIEEAKQKFSQYGNIVEKAVVELFNAHNEKIANNLGDIIDDNLQYASVDSKNFKNTFNQINEKNIVEVLKSYRKRFNGENLATAIMKERSASNNAKIESVKKLYNMLYTQIDKNKYSTTEIEKTFNDFLKNPLANAEINKLDKLFNTMISMVEGADAEGIVDTDLATNSAKARTSNAQKTADYKEISQGGVSRALDKLAGASGGMTKEKVDKIIQEHEKELAHLESLKGDYKAYCAEFKKIFGVEYKPAAVANYNTIQKRYENAQTYHLYEQTFLQDFSKELKTKDIDRIYTHEGLEAAQKTYDDFYSKLCKFFSKEFIDNYLKASNADNMMPHDKYKVLHKFVKAQEEMIHKYTVEQCGGVEFSELEASRNSAYHAAYGTQKDTYLVAKDWVNSQNQRLATTKIAVNVAAMAGAMFTGGGTIALISSAALLTDPISFAEQATDIDGMSKEYWHNFLIERAEMLGWMALGMGASTVGKAAAKFVKFKGLSNILGQGGKSIDDLLKNPNLPAETRNQLASLKTKADLAGISTEVLVDMTTTALLKKEGATSGDWIASLAGAIAGSSLGNRLLKMEQPNAIKALQETFPDLKITSDEALQIIKNINDKAQKWANTPTQKNNNRLNSSVIGVTPEMVESGAKAVVRTVSNIVSKFLKNIEGKNYLNQIETDALAKYAEKKPKFANAIKDGINEIAHRISNGEYPSREMKKEIINGLSEKYPDLNPTKLQDELEYVMEKTLRQEGWRGIAQCMMYSEKWGLEDGYDKYILKPFKEQKGWVEKTSENTTTTTSNPEAVKETTVTKQEFDYDELIKKYPEVENTTFFGGTKSQSEALKFLEEYPTILKEEGITTENFHDLEYLIYRRISGFDINPNDHDRVFNIVKKYYHQDVIKLDATAKEFKLGKTEQVIAGNKVVEDIRNKIKNNEKIDDNYIREKLEEILPNEYDNTYKKIENYINSHDDIKLYIDDCTHRDIYNNFDYTNIYQKETIDNCVKVMDWILSDVQSGKPMTKEMIEEYMNHGLITTAEFGQEFLDEILSKHRILGPMYLQVKGS